jgi:hypothetical protein
MTFFLHFQLYMVRTTLESLIADKSRWEENSEEGN